MKNRIRQHGLILVLVAFSVGCIVNDSSAEERDSTKWWCLPKTNAVPLNAVELLLIYQGQREDKGRPYPQASGRLLLRFKNVSKQTIDDYNAFHLFGFGTLFLAPPEGTNLQCQIPRTFGGSFSVSPLEKVRDIAPQDQLEFLIGKPVYEWFPFPSDKNSADGIYRVWWQIDDKTSNVILFRKDKNKIERIEEGSTQP